MNPGAWPRTFQEATVYFSDPDTAFAEMIGLRWSDGVVRCPACGSSDVYFTRTRRLWQCKNAHTRRQFSIKVGSLMEDSAIGLHKWLLAVWLVAQTNDAVSSYELSHALRITQKSAWAMRHRIRLALLASSNDPAPNSLFPQMPRDQETT